MIFKQSLFRKSSKTINNFNHKRQVVRKTSFHLLHYNISFVQGIVHRSNKIGNCYNPVDQIAILSSTYQDKIQACYNLILQDCIDLDCILNRLDCNFLDYNWNLQGQSCLDCSQNHLDYSWILLDYIGLDCNLNRLD